MKGTDPSRVRELLGAAPTPSEIEPGEAQDLMHRIITRPSPSVQAMASQASPPNRRLPVSGLLALAACAAVVTVTAVRSSGDRAPRSASLDIRAAVAPRADVTVPDDARTVLVAAASASQRRGSSATPTIGRSVIYQKVVAAYLGTVGGPLPYSRLAPETQETWVTTDGSTEIRHTYAPPIWPSSEDERRAHVQGGPPAHQSARTDRFGPGELNGDLGQLSSDPRVLADELAAAVGAGTSVSARTFERIHGYLGDPRITPDLQAALYRVIATLPGVAVIGGVTDQLGRPGVAVGITSGYSGGPERYELIIDPQTGRLLEAQELSLVSRDFVHGKPPIQIAFEIYDQTSTVAKIGDEPSPRTGVPATPGDAT